MLINGSYGSVMQNLVHLSAKYRFFAKLPDYHVALRDRHATRFIIQKAPFPFELLSRHIQPHTLIFAFILLSYALTPIT